MSTPQRAQAARRYKAEATCPFPKGTDGERKPDHYGETAKVTESILDFFFRDYDADPQDFRRTMTTSRLGQVFLSQLEYATMLTLGKPELSDSIAFLETSQQQNYQKDNRRWRTFEGTLGAGVQTAINTLENLYDILANSYSSDVIANQKSGQIILRIAQLHNNQFTPFRDAYLQQMNGTSPVLRLQDYLVLEGEENTRLAFSPGNPDAIPVPSKYIELSTKQLVMSEEYVIPDLASEPMTRLDEIEAPEDSPRIGCPVTFTPEHMRRLWQVYTNERAALSRRQLVSQKALDVTRAT